MLCSLCLKNLLFAAISVAQCLLVISEDNPVAWKMLSEHVSVFQSLLTLDGDYRAVILRTVAAGIASNVPVLSMQCFSPIVEALSKTFDINHRQILNDLTSRLPLNESGEDAQPKIEIVDDEMAGDETEENAATRRLREDLPTELEREINDVGYLLSAQRIAAEILTNICSPEGSDSKDDMDDISDAESVHDYDMSENGNGTQICEDKIPVELSEAVKAHKIVEKVSKFFQFDHPVFNPQNIPCHNKSAD